jgi:hypothetical protein
MSNIPPIPVLTGTDPMSFGKYAGQPMQDVPATYLHWLWHSETTNPAAMFRSSGLYRDTAAKYIPTVSEKSLAVREYIKRSMSGLQQETPDLIWDTRKEV